MKKYLNLLFVAIFASMTFAFVACGDDDEPDNNGTPGTTTSFVGTWEMTSSGVLGDGDGDTYMQIASDHTFVLINDYGYDDVEVSYGTWKSTNNTFTVNYEIAHGASPFVPTVTYMIESTASKSFVLSLGVQKFTFTKVPDSVMGKYEDDIKDILSENGNSSTSTGKLKINGNEIGFCLNSVCGSHSFSGEKWVYFDLLFNDGKNMIDYNGTYNFNLSFNFKSLSSITEGENLIDDLDLIHFEHFLGEDPWDVGGPIVDGSRRYSEIKGSIKATKITTKEITLQFTNFKFTVSSVNNSSEKTYSFNGTVTYDIE